MRERGPSAASWALRLLGVAIFGASAYVLFLVMTAPAALVARVAPDLPEDAALSGTIWHGAALFRNGTRLAWDFDAAASVASFAPVFAVEASGDDTQLTGTAQADPLARPMAVTLRGVTGRAGWSLVEAVAPDVAIRCTPLATVDIAAVTLRRDRSVYADGTLRSREGTCTAPGVQAPVPVPPLLARIATDPAGNVRAVLTTQDAPDTTLAEARLDADALLTLTVQPEGARRVPGLPTGFPIVLEMSLR